MNIDIIWNNHIHTHIHIYTYIHTDTCTNIYRHINKIVL